MSITKVDCHFLRGSGASLDTSAYVAFNPCSKPGMLVAAGAQAARGNIGGQVACRLSLEHFVEGVIDFLGAQEAEPTNGTHGGEGATELSVKILEAAYRRANNSVYSFGHKLAAGGRMAASLLGLVIESGTIAAGRVGSGSAYLFRGGELFPFFEPAGTARAEGASEGFVGANSLVSVELASVPAFEADIVLVSSSSIETQRELQLADAIREMSVEPDCSCKQLAGAIGAYSGDSAFLMVARMGPNAIYLGRAVA